MYFTGMPILWWNSIAILLYVNPTRLYTEIKLTPSVQWEIFLTDFFNKVLNASVVVVFSCLNTQFRSVLIKKIFTGNKNLFSLTHFKQESYAILYTWWNFIALLSEWRVLPKILQLRSKHMMPSVIYQHWQDGELASTTPEYSSSLKYTCNSSN